MRESATQNSPLPPSVEKAYHQKCIAMKRRLREVEEANDAARLRVQRIERAVTKMRIERAILLDALAKKQQEAGKEEEEEKSDSEAPSPRDIPHVKRKRSSAPSTDRNTAIPTPTSGHPHFPAASHHAFPAPGMPFAPTHYASSTAATGRNQSQPSLLHASPYPSNASLPYGPPSAPSATHPKITALPNGTSVMLIAPGTPKPSPWTINELDPRHHYKATFDELSLDDQETALFAEEYLPFDVYGKPIRVEYFTETGKYRHMFPGDAGWTDPIRDSVRRDAAEYREPIGLAAKRRFRREAGPVAVASQGRGQGGRAGEGRWGSESVGHSRGPSDGVREMEDVRRERDRGREREDEDEDEERGQDHGPGGPGGFTAVNR